MEPIVEFPLPCPLTDHVTPAFELPVTAAAKLCVAAARTFAVGGETTSATTEAGVTCAVKAAEAMGPGLGLLTKIATFPTCVLVALPVAVSCVEDTRVVESTVPLKLIVAPTAKCAPFTVIVKAPTGIDVGVMVVTCGVGFCSVSVALAVLAALAVSVAVTITEPVAGGNSGHDFRAVNRGLALMFVESFEMRQKRRWR